jgi:hypothetical protein
MDDNLFDKIYNSGKSNWIRLLNRNNIQLGIFLSKYNENYRYKAGDKYLEIKTKTCMLCNDPLLRVRYNKKHNFFVIKTCQKCCPNTSVVDIKRFKTLFPEDNAIKNYKEFCLYKTKGFKSNIKYWINLGYSEEVAKRMVLDNNTEQGNKSADKYRGTSINSCRSTEFYLHRGYSMSEAEEFVRQIQTTNGLEYYIEKYGEMDGPTKFKERIEKWIFTLYSNNDMNIINGKKGFTREMYVEKYGLEQFLVREKRRLKKQKATLIKNGITVSDEYLNNRKEYVDQVLYYTRKSLAHYFYEINPENLPISYEGNHVDHIYSKHMGFMNKIQPEIIGSYKNLRVVPRKDNLSKRSKSLFTTEELLNHYETIDDNWRIIRKNSIFQEFKFSD